MVNITVSLVISVRHYKQKNGFYSCLFQPKRLFFVKTSALDLVNERNCLFLYCFQHSILSLAVKAEPQLRLASTSANLIKIVIIDRFRRLNLHKRNHIMRNARLIALCVGNLHFFAGWTARFIHAAAHLPANFPFKRYAARWRLIGACHAGIHCCNRFRIVFRHIQPFCPVKWNPEKSAAGAAA